jgi:superfamily I DNA and/or RNA helicase
MVSSGKISLLENELRELYRDKQALSEEIVLLRARENVTDELQFNRLNNRVTYRDLLHQVTKKKKIWPIRKLLTEFSDEIFKLVPCWLASPESVSAIFPMTDLFDLVIFDEASQCFAEQGIPALYRGKQVVVAGDTMQLKPGDFYQARWQEEDFDHPDSEVDSLLDLSSRYLMHVQLKGHYRSKTPELIAFSNQHFYKNNLQFLPDRHALNHPDPVMLYEKLEGVWENNTNLAEAHRVAELILILSAEAPGKQIGIITFNAPQQALIMDLLEEAFNTRQQHIPETVFVKNIENVQGDESDVIIFSIGYAPDAKGHVSAQFGSLNLAGGENRLNVAVSRAREKIIVVTSLWPEQLNVENTLNEGPKLLKKYLQFVWQVSRNEYKPVIHSTNNKTINPHLKTEIKKHVAERWSEYELEDSYLPYFDFIAKKEGKPLGALFTDDNQYHQSLSVKADHAIYPQLLEHKHWPFLRVYTRNLWQDPEKFYNEIGKFLNQ